MLRRLGSRPEFTVRWKQRTVRRLHSGTKFNPRQYNCPGEHCHAPGRHDSDYSGLDLAERDFSEYHYSWVYFP